MGVSPNGSQECAVISKDVGNFFICVVVIGVLFFKVTYDVSLAPLLNREAEKIFENINCTILFNNAEECVSETDYVFTTHIHRINLPHGVYLFHWVDLLLADEVCDGYH